MPLGRAQDAACGFFRTTPTERPGHQFRRPRHDTAPHLETQTVQLTGADIIVEPELAGERA